MAVYMVMNLGVTDFDAWKSTFDSDPAGRRDSGALSHVVSRSVDDPNDVFIRVEFPSTDAALAFRQRLVASGVLETQTVKMGPAVIESVENVTY